MVYKYNLEWKWRMLKVSPYEHRPSSSPISGLMDEEIREKMTSEFESYGCEVQFRNTNHSVGQYYRVAPLPFSDQWVWWCDGTSRAEFLSCIPPTESPALNPVLIKIIMAVIGLISTFVIGYFVLEGLKTLKVIITGVEQVNGTIITGGGAYIDEEGNIEEIPYDYGAGASATIKLVAILGTVGFLGYLYVSSKGKKK